MSKFSNQFPALLLAASLFLYACQPSDKGESSEGILFRHVTLIDGNGEKPLEDVDLLVKGDTIAAIGKDLDSSGVSVQDFHGKTIMPALISAHAHVGTLKGTTTVAENYTRENILRQLKKYQDFGVLHVQCMGTDRPMLYENQLYDSLKNGLLPGARLLSAGYGFGVPVGGPPSNFGMDKVFRPVNVEEIKAELDTLANLPIDMVKIWVDDFGGSSPKMSPEFYSAIIKGTHQQHKRVASHLYYAEDAKKLVAEGIDIIAHSIRDKEVDDALIQQIKAAGVQYIPTLSLDEFAFIYGQKPAWIDDPFFKASLEPGVLEMITSADYQKKLRESPAYSRNMKAFETALKNVKKLYDAGILVAMGTDSGANPIRAQGFSEHLELALMVQAGLSPLQAIGVATKNAAALLKIDQDYGTIVPGKVADFIVLTASPIKDIKNTRKIEQVYKAGKLVSQGPLSAD